MSESIAERAIAKTLLDLADSQANANNHVHLDSDAATQLAKVTHLSPEDAGAALRALAHQGFITFTNAMTGTTIIIINSKALAHLASASID